MRKRGLAVVSALMLLFSVFPVANAEEIPEKQYIVKYKPSGIALMHEDSGNGSFDVVNEASLKELCKENRIAWYEEDYEVELMEDTSVDSANDPKYDESKWDLSMLQADFPYMLNCEGQNVKIGVIDSGIAEHEELNANVLEGYDYINNTTDTHDTYGHGTFVSGIIAAADDNKGIIGAAPKAKLVPLKCFNEKTTKLSVICNAIYGAVDEFGCDIINMSFGLTENSTALKEAIDYAVNHGIIVVAAVGNAGNTSLFYPAAYDNVIGVGAVDQNGVVASISQHNQSVFITAPGVQVKSTSYLGGYTTGNGTSYATPFVSAAAAMMLSADEALNLEQIKNFLSVSAVDKGAEGYDVYYGYGILNLKNCMLNLLEGTRYFLSPVETEQDKVSAVVFNNTETDFSGLFLACEYDGDRLRAFTKTELSVPAGKTVAIANSTPNDSAKYFIWNSMEDNTPISNTRRLNTIALTAQ